MINKKLTGALIASTLAFVGVAHASPCKQITRDKVNYNVGADFSPFKKNSKMKNHVGVNIFAGVRLNEYLGVEFGLGTFGRLKTVNNVTYNNVKNIYADILGYIPIHGSNIELMGSLGIGSLYTKSTNKSVPTAVTKSHLSVAAIRVGAGAQYNLDQNWAMRAMVRYQLTNPGSVVGNNLGGTLGIVYNFN